MAFLLRKKDAFDKFKTKDRVLGKDGKSNSIEIIKEVHLKDCILDHLRTKHKTLNLSINEDTLYFLRRKYFQGIVTRENFKAAMTELENHLSTYKRMSTEGVTRNVSGSIFQAHLKKNGTNLETSLIDVILKLYGNGESVIEPTQFVNLSVFLSYAEEEFNKKDLMKSGALTFDYILELLERFNIELLTPTEKNELQDQFNTGANNVREMDFSGFVKFLLNRKLTMKRRRTIVKRAARSNVENPTVARYSAFTIQGVCEVELKYEAPDGLFASPYSATFTLLRYPWLMIGSGSMSSANDQIASGPLSKTFNISPNESGPTDSESQSLKIILAGDLMIMNKEQAIEAVDIYQDLFDSADLVVMNVESPVCKIERNPNVSMTAKDGLQFNMSLEFVAETLKNLKITPRRTLLGVANNHSGDMGEEGLMRTQEYLSDIGTVPIGASRYNGNCRGILTKVTTKDVTVGIVAWTKWMNNSSKHRHLPVFREEDVLSVNWKEVKKQHDIDVLIGFPHWDYEQSFIPAPDTSTLAYKLLVEYDFDLIAGHGPHVLQTVEIIGGKKAVAFSLGNTCSERGTWHTKMGGFLEVNISNKKLAGYKVHPYVQEQVDGGVLLVPLEQSSNRHKFNERIQKLYDLRPLLDSTDKIVYRVKVTTATDLGAGTDSRIFLKFFGDQSETNEMELEGPLKQMFESGSSDEFFLPLETDPGELLSVQVRMEPQGFASAWKLDRVEVLNVRTNAEWAFACGLWFDKRTTSMILKATQVSEPYFEIDDIIPKLTTGDIIAFEGMAITSAIIKTLTNSPYSHVGIVVVKKEDGKKKQLLYESTARAFTSDIYWEDWYEGVHCFDIKKRVASYPGRVWLIRLKEKLPKPSRVAVGTYLDEKHKAKTPFDKMQLTTLGFIQVGFKFSNEEDEDMLFCSEMVASALKSAQVISSDINPAVQTPTDVTNYSIYDSFRPILLKHTRKVIEKS